MVCTKNPEDLARKIKEQAARESQEITAGFDAIEARLKEMNEVEEKLLSEGLDGDRFKVKEKRAEHGHTVDEEGINIMETKESADIVNERNGLSIVGKTGRKTTVLSTASKVPELTEVVQGPRAMEPDNVARIEEASEEHKNEPLKSCLQTPETQVDTASEFVSGRMAPKREEVVCEKFQGVLLSAFSCYEAESHVSFRSG